MYKTDDSFMETVICKNIIFVPGKDAVEPDFDYLAHGIEIGAAVGAEHAFGLTRGAGGVVHRERSFFVRNNAWQWIGCRGGEKFLVGIIVTAGVGNTDDLQPAEVEVGDLWVEGFVDKEETRTGVGEDMGDFSAL